MHVNKVLEVCRLCIAAAHEWAQNAIEIEKKCENVWDKSRRKTGTDQLYDLPIFDQTAACIFKSPDIL